MTLYDKYGKAVGDKEDAHVLSNYRDWRRTSRIVTNVEIRFETTGMSDEDAINMDRCLRLGVNFALVSKDLQFVCVIPNTNTLFQDGVTIHYDKPIQMINAIKLLLFTFNRLYIPFDNDDKLLENGSNNLCADTTGAV